jgi:hypothetical protein
MSALARRHRRADLPGVLKLGMSDMGPDSFREVAFADFREGKDATARAITVAQNSIISTVFMINISKRPRVEWAR